MCIRFVERRGAFDFAADLGNFIGSTAVIGAASGAAIVVTKLALQSFTNSPPPTALSALLTGVSYTGQAACYLSSGLAIAGVCCAVYMLYCRPLKM